MKHKRWKLWFGVGLVSLSAAFYGLHYLLFHDSHYIFSYLIGHVAFVPIEVLLATLIIHRLLEVHEKQAMLQKMNMAIGVFYSEMGSELLSRFQSFDLDRGMLARDLIVHNDWTQEKFAGLIRKYSGHHLKVDCLGGDIRGLGGFLAGKRPFLVGLLGNQNLLEHDEFTELLWAVLHLSEELGCRDGARELGKADCAHLSEDIRRAYSRLITGWLSYMLHLKKDYPYLFSLAVRTNPFDPEARPEVV